MGTGNEAERGTGKWSQIGVPHRGWSCIDIEDLEDDRTTCEMCETQEIRYVHHMAHPRYDGELGVGCVCAGRMEEDYEAAQNRERVVRSAAGRKRRWLQRKWSISARGNTYTNADGYNVVVYRHASGPLSGSWGFRVSNRLTEDGLRSCPGWWCSCWAVAEPLATRALHMAP